MTARGGNHAVLRWLALAAALAAGIAVVYSPLLLTTRVLANGDALTYFTPYRDYANAALRDGRLPLWNPYLFLGAPFIANPQSAVFYPLHWPFIFLPVVASLKASLALHLWLTGLGAAMLARRVARLSWLAALVTGLVWSLSGYFGARAGQINQLSAAAALPWLLVLLEASVPRWSLAAAARRDDARAVNWATWAGLAVLVAVQLLAGHSQSSYINLAALMLAALWPALPALGEVVGRVARRRQSRADAKPPHPNPLPKGEGTETRNDNFSASPLPVGEGLGVRALSPLPVGEGLGVRVGLALLAILAGAGLVAVQLLPTLELSDLSIRSGGLSYREAVAFSLSPRFLLFSLLPSYGESLGQRFNSPAFGEYVAAVGVIALALAMLGLLGARRRAWAGGWGLAVGLTVIGLGLAIGVFNPLYFVLYKLAPGFDLFRAPARWLLLYTLGISLLAGYGVDQARQAPLAWWPDVRRVADAGRGLLRRAGGVGWLAMAVGLAAALAVQHWPGWRSVVGWLLALVVLAALLPRLHRGRRWPAVALAAAVTLELAASSLVLPHRHPSAPEAVASLRTAPAHLLVAAREAEAAGRIPARFLSASGITYDPGDLADLRAFDPAGAGSAVEDLVVASKLQEIVAPNLSLLWRLTAVDGYDGGVLPLRRYVDLQTLFLPPEALSEDGRLRERLESIPPSRLLRLLGVSFVVTDKTFDLWRDDVYYDLEVSTPLAPGQKTRIAGSDEMAVTGLGLWTRLEGAADAPNGAAVAEVQVHTADGAVERFTLAAGRDTAEGAWTDAAAHSHPAARQPLPRGQAGFDYLARFEWPTLQTVTSIEVSSLLDRGEVVLRGVSLIDRTTGAHVALTLPGDGDFRLVHSGDVKIYHNLQLTPRVAVLYQATLAADDPAALEALAADDFDPAQRVVLLADEATAGPGARTIAGLQAGSPPAAVQVQRYQPEHVVINATLPAAGVLVLSDAWYPGWQATVDGQPVATLRANYYFRGVWLPAGSHQVVWRFQPTSLRRGAQISAGAVVLLLVALLWHWTQRAKTRRMQA